MPTPEKTHFDLPQLTGSDDNIGKVLAGRYRLLRELGAGQMARVYVAEQIAMGRNVAVKILSGEVDDVAIERFRREMTAVSRLRSPHTIRFYDAGTCEGSRFIAMELLAGETLRERLERDPELAPREVVDIVAQIGASLAEAHDAGVLHRDLKPENIYFCDHPTPLRPFVKVLDFGLAKLVDVDPASKLTGECQTVGTPAYMAPEMIVRGRSVDHRSDVYALGVVCYEMLTGERPFDAETPMRMLLAHVNAPIPRVGGELDGFFSSVLAKKADDRPESAADVAGLLAEALGLLIQSLGSFWQIAWATTKVPRAPAQTHLAPTESLSL